VRQSKVLLLDEATSSVDYDTDALIQRTIRDEFTARGATVLTIAHRLRTILDADKIVVMDAGLVREYAPPAKLLQNPKSLFSQLVEAEQREEESYATDEHPVEHGFSSSNDITDPLPTSRREAPSVVFSVVAPDANVVGK
jgi:ABC-type glutathione transport system ATPase component